MKPPKKSAKEKVLEKNPALFIEKEGDLYKIIYQGKTGRHNFGEGRTEEGAWNSCAAFYGLK